MNVNRLRKTIEELGSCDKLRVRRSDGSFASLVGEDVGFSRGIDSCCELALDVIRRFSSPVADWAVCGSEQAFKIAVLMDGGDRYVFVNGVSVDVDGFVVLLIRNPEAELMFELVSLLPFNLNGDNIDIIKS